jgi:Nucleoside-diphosphate-sugar epimerases
MKVMITGSMGYIGPVLVRYLRNRLPNAEIYGFDSGYFAHSLTGVTRMPETLLNRQYFGDIREFPEDLLQGIDVVVHLAAVSNDPMGSKFEQVTKEINQNASYRLARLCVAAGVKSFVFASSCSTYGYAESGPRKESDDLNPLTAYAHSKVGAEKLLCSLANQTMAITCLRFATACGMSDRLRLDLVLNDFVASALSSGEITILSDGTPWRPLIDVEDMARAIFWAIKRDPARDGEFLVVNAGRDENNYQVRELAETVARHVPGTRVRINTDAPPDKRSYKVDFSLFRKLAPDHVPQVTLEQSVLRLIDGIKRTPEIGENFRGSSFMRLKMLEKHIAESSIGADLRWIAA